MVNKDRLINEFLELVQIDSETRNEAQISKVLKEKFSALGLEVVEDDSAERSGHESGNLFCTLKASEGKESLPVLFFTSHMDTVAPGNGIKPTLGEDGYIRSDGTTILGADDKAGIAVMLETLRVLQEQNIPHGTLRFVITAGEEAGLKGARSMDPALMQNQYKADFGYALDSNGSIGDIAVAAPSQMKMYITFTGKASHAGVNPEEGISAITVASKAVSRMPLGRVDLETTANIGYFAGGRAANEITNIVTNIVVDSVTLVAEARSLETDKLNAQVEAMRKACESAATEMGAGCEFKTELMYPSYKYDETSPVVQLASRALENKGKTVKLFHSGGGSDANVFNGMGIPTVNLAVGYNQIHTTNENILAQDIVDLADVVVEIVKEATKG